MKFKKIIDDVKNIEECLTLPSGCVSVFGSARFDDESLYSRAAYNLSFRLASSGFTIITGGGGGIMKAANKGAYDAKNTQSVGFNVILPNEQKINEFVTNGTVFSHLALRKVALIEKSDFFVIFPGGYGTLDELFEILVLVQNGMKNAKIYLFGVEFFTSLVYFINSSLVGEKTIAKVDTQLFMLTDDIDEIYDDIAKFSSN
ncbi:TIGR00730 family Rossman fold protein [Campylobacter geochelonis]|uniref:Cytokinin riboside 5'-monophosphate phosphoribohydrolase n=1 Tax=Campylobacter geochelonis TaxID=1780362 RepID=A0A128EI51_9BACT|nr:TIGR00730 family Rossman fold protein [Campylobacter geochelonis]QKF70738.1 putative lysine decarboxylase family protein [Campylobacter geochelonis]CZE47272.1 Predicted Rossmann fold nucleotide-binding protein%2C possible lysine decarboxylase [Campylobacter geochelonis]CZE48585.1 Predicted Rossmann fold nucleotide-binding protein%2C possible lysine decarboxylase [Campylobacter geochelonis]CZE50508.1 Predicted Rossmann fold nucleotide-binding protein%2C possible lysine decarboxylase [Campylob